MTTTVPDNPDTRPLPDGWVQEYDQRRQRWFYKQPSATPPRVSYAHPLGALKPSIAIKRAPPILNVRGLSQAAPQSPASSPRPAEGPIYAQHLYKNVSTPVTPVVTSPSTTFPSAAVSNHAAMPNLPAHMRRILTGSDISPTREGPRSSDRRATIGSYSATSPTNAAPAPRKPFTAPDVTMPTSSALGLTFDHPLPPLPPRTPPHRRASTSDDSVRATARPLSVRHSVQRRQTRSQSVSVGLPFIAPPPQPQTHARHRQSSVPRPAQPSSWARYRPTSFDPVPQVPIDVFAEPPGRYRHESRGTSFDLPPPTALGQLPSQPHHRDSSTPPPQPAQSQPPTSFRPPQQRYPIPEYQPTTYDPPAQLPTSPPLPYQLEQPAQTNGPPSSAPSFVDVGVQACSDSDLTAADYGSSKVADDAASISDASTTAYYEPVTALDGGALDLLSAPSEGVGFALSLEAVDLVAAEDGPGLSALSLGEGFGDAFAALMAQTLQGGLGSEGDADRAPPYDPGF